MNVIHGWGSVNDMDIGSEVRLVGYGENLSITAVIDGDYRTVRTGMLPYAFVEDVDVVAGIDLPNLEETDLKVKNGGRVFKFSADNPAQIGEYRKQLAAKGIQTYEADIRYVRRIFVDRLFDINYKNRIAYIDTEYDDSSGVFLRDGMPLVAYSVGWNGAIKTETLQSFSSEYELLSSLLMTLMKLRKTVLIGWNVDFDIRNLKMRAMRLGQKVSFFDFVYAYDLRQAYRQEVKGLTSYSLAEVATYEKVGRKERQKRIVDMTRKELEEYNRNDVWLLMEIEKKYGFVERDTTLMREVGLPLSMNTQFCIGDTLVLRRIRELGYVAPNTSKTEKEKYAGAYVRDPTPGYYRNVAVLDAVSLYPTVVMTNMIDIDGFDGEVLPFLVKYCYEKKLEETRRNNKVKKDAYKLMGNALYGLLGYVKFRYYDPRKAGQVTSGGREVLKRLIELSETLGFKVLAGDTDSVFVKVDGVEKIDGLVAYLNRQLAPYEVRVDHLFDQLVIFAKEGGGAKKRYVGIENGRMFARGIELRRSDWCALAKQCLADALSKLFGNQDMKRSIEEIREMMRRVKIDLYAGKLDKHLVITKGVKFGVYKVKTMQGEALRQAREASLVAPNVGEISYFVSAGRKVCPYVNDVQTPLVNLDYDWYWDKQINPPIQRLMRSIAPGRQMSL